MEDCKTKYIESSLAAFRAIKTFVFIKGIYPRNFNSGFWDEEDYKNPDLRLSMRNEFEQYLEMLASVHNDYAKTLYDAMPHIESEYNNLVINSRNLEQAVKLFKEKYKEAMIVIEYEMDVNQLLLRYLAPLKKHAITAAFTALASGICTMVWSFSTMMSLSRLRPLAFQVLLL